ncbi:MAG: choice-of-anchor I family protein [Flavobacteriales bacterium]|nr:choice-of-anchor I family protein [Flavobacteriales bacterium]
MKRTFKKLKQRLGFVCGLLYGVPVVAQGPGLVISEFLANPAGTDSPFEYVELVATRNIDFSVTPYSVIVCNNGTANANGWIAGAGISYAFQINSGTVTSGSIVYVGGDQMAITGTKLRVINTATTAGDGLGNANASGVIGNGGANADGIAVFNLPVSSITSSTVPVDAVFFGTGGGTAVVNGGLDGYQLPVNDLYAGGKLQSTSFFAPDPASGVAVFANGTYDLSTGNFSTIRSWSTGAISDGTTGITLSASLTPATVSFTVTNQTVNENAATATINVAVSNSNASPSYIDFTVKTLSSASRPADYSISNFTLTIPANTSGNVPFTIAITDDALVESDEFVVVQMNGFQNAVAGSNNLHALYIRDNDNAAPVANNELVLTLLHSFSNGVAGTNSAEIVYHDPGTQRLFIANSVGKKLDIVNFSNPSAPVLINSVDITPYGNINSVAVKNGLVAAAVEDINPQDSGWVVFFDAAGTFIKKVRVGAMPDMITFNHAGTMVITANEGEPNAAYTVDPNGSITTVDLSAGIAAVDQSSVTFINFTAFNGQEALLRSQGIRIFGPGASASQDLEPEYVAVSEDDQSAWITLQENNAVVKIDLVTKTITGIFPLGTKDHSLINNRMDISNQSAAANLSNWPIKGFYMPDAIAQFSVGGTNYFITANEGDSRAYTGYSEEVRISSANLDPTVFPYASDLKKNYLAGRLNITTANGDIDNDGDLDEIYCYGARSFSIWNGNTGAMVYDSGDDLEQISLNHPLYSAFFNASNSGAAVVKDRSDDKGPEPEGVTVGSVNGHQYLFLGLERIGGVMVFNIDNPTSPQFVTYMNNRTGNGSGPDLGAEGIIFIPASQSPNGNDLVILANEISSTLSIYQVQTCEATLPMTINAASSTSFCSGESVDLTLANSAGHTIQWLQNNVALSGETSATINIDAAGDYAVKVTSNTYGCTDTSAVQTITVFTLPTVVANVSDASICIGDSVQFTGSGAQSYTWDNGVTEGNYFTPMATATYQVTGTDVNNCSATASVDVTVNSLPSVMASASINPVCENFSTVFTGSGALTYTWDNGIIDGQSFTALTTTTVGVLGTDANGCSDSAYVTLQVIPAPQVTASVSSIEICEGESVVFNGSGAVSYSWDNGVTNGLPYTPSATQSYTVTGTDNNCCTASDQISVTVHPLPSMPVITANMNVLTSTSANSYQWYLNGSSIGGANAQSYTATSNGNYSVEITDQFGCSNSSAVFVFNSLGLNEADIIALQVSVFPNPFNNETTLRIIADKNSNAIVRVQDAIGRELSVQNISLLSGQNDIRLNDRHFSDASGVLFLSIQIDNEIKTMRIVRMH